MFSDEVILCVFLVAQTVGETRLQRLVVCCLRTLQQGRCLWTKMPQSFSCGALWPQDHPDASNRARVSQKAKTFLQFPHEPEIQVRFLINEFPGKLTHETHEGCFGNKLQSWLTSTPVCKGLLCRVRLEFSWECRLCNVCLGLFIRSGCLRAECICVLYLVELD